MPTSCPSALVKTSCSTRPPSTMRLMSGPSPPLASDNLAQAARSHKRLSQLRRVCLTLAFSLVRMRARHLPPTAQRRQRRPLRPLAISRRRMANRPLTTRAWPCRASRLMTATSRNEARLLAPRAPLPTLLRPTVPLFRRPSDRRHFSRPCPGLDLRACRQPRVSLPHRRVCSRRSLVLHALQQSPGVIPTLRRARSHLSQC